VLIKTLRTSTWEREIIEKARGHWRLLSAWSPSQCLRLEIFSLGGMGNAPPLAYYDIMGVYSPRGVPVND